MSDLHPHIEMLLQVPGAKRWSKGGHDRIYFNDLAKWCGLEVERYNTGNICSATLNGKVISNSYAKRILSDLQHGTFFFNIKTCNWVVEGMKDHRIPESLIWNIENAAGIWDDRDPEGGFLEA